MDDRLQALGVAAFALDDRVVPVGAVKSGIAREVVGDEAASRPHGGAHEAAQLVSIGGRQDGEPREAGDDVGERALAVAGDAGDADDLVRAHREVDGIEQRLAVRTVERNRFEAEHLGARRHGLRLGPNHAAPDHHFGQGVPVGVGGRDLSDLGLSGPAVGRVLALVRSAVLDGQVMNREEALALAREHARRRRH